MVLHGTVAAALVALLAGCETSNTPDERSEGRVTDDKKISENVRKELESEPVYKFEGVKVATFGGVVQLSGFVDINDQKRRAGDLAAEVPGVMQVDNGITLKPAPMKPTGRTNEVVEPKIYSQ